MFKFSKRVIIFLAIPVIVVPVLLIAKYKQENKFNISKVSRIDINNNGVINVEEIVNINVKETMNKDLIIPITLQRDDTTDFYIMLDGKKKISTGNILEKNDDIYYYSTKKEVFIDNTEMLDIGNHTISIKYVCRASDVMEKYDNLSILNLNVSKYIEDASIEITLPKNTTTFKSLNKNVVINYLNDNSYEVDLSELHVSNEETVKIAMDNIIENIPKIHNTYILDEEI